MGLINPAGTQAWRPPPRQEQRVIYEGIWPQSGVYTLHCSPCSQSRRQVLLLGQNFPDSSSKFRVKQPGCESQLCHLLALWPWTSSTYWAINVLIWRKKKKKEKNHHCDMQLPVSIKQENLCKCLQHRCPEWIHIPSLLLHHQPHTPAQIFSTPAAQKGPWIAFKN